MCLSGGYYILGMFYFSSVPKSNLPPEVEALIAAIALYAGMMLVMAVATEIVVDTLRLAVGFKRKVTAMEAIKQVQDQLPAQLAELGVSATDRDTVRYFANDIAKKVAKPAEGVATTVTLIKAGEFSGLDGSLSKIESTLKDNGVDNLPDVIPSDIQTKLTDFKNNELRQLTGTIVAFKPEGTLEDLFRVIQRPPVTSLPGMNKVLTDERIDVLVEELADDYHSMVTPKMGELSKAIGDFDPTNTKTVKALHEAVMALREPFQEYAEKLVDSVLRVFSDWLMQRVELTTSAAAADMQQRVRASGIAEELRKSLGISDDDTRKLIEETAITIQNASLRATSELLKEVERRRAEIAN